MAVRRVWIFCPVASVGVVQAALDLATLGGAVQLIGRFPLTSPVLAYAGIQAEESLTTLVESALASVLGAHVFRGATWGMQSDADQGVIQEADVTAIQGIPPGATASRRACIKEVYKRLLLGAPPLDATASQA